MSHKRKSRKKKRLFSILLILLLLVIIGCGGVLAYKIYLEPAPTLTVSAKAPAIKQEEALSSPSLTVTCVGDKNRILDISFSKLYTVKDLMADIKSGKIYTISCDADTSVEGEYPLTLTLNKKAEEDINGKWVKRVVLTTKESMLVVENKYGQWDGDTKFKDWNGNDVTSAWIISNGKNYYFDGDGNKVTGVQNIDGKVFIFDNQGVRLDAGWQDTADGKYRLGDDGAALVGWQDIDGKTYYFGTDGKMLAGTSQLLDGYRCTFNDDGTLADKKQEVDPSKPMIAITFDDGPGSDTSRLLDAVESNGIHVTFFMQGKNVGSHSAEVSRMEALGCELGNHSWDHPQLSTLSAAGIQQQVGDTNNAIAAVVGHGATVLRPPYGDTNATVAANVGLPQIIWSVDTLDWKTKSKDQTVQAILGAGDGDIVLLHDIHSWSVDAAIEAFPQLLANGYQLVTVSEMANAKGVALENGGKYADFY